MPTRFVNLPVLLVCLIVLLCLWQAVSDPLQGAFYANPSPAQTKHGNSPSLSDHAQLLELIEKVHELEVKVHNLENLLATRSQPEKSASSGLSVGWKDKNIWRKLQRGMSEDNVRGLLGEPGKIDVQTSGGGQFWFYPDALGGDVHFDASGHVDGWSEPTSEK
jgi:hypothetical protein